MVLSPREKSLQDISSEDISPTCYHSREVTGISRKYVWSNREHTKLFIFCVATMKANSLLSTSQNLQMKKTHKCIPQVGQQKHWLFTKVIFVFFSEGCNACQCWSLVTILPYLFFVYCSTFFKVRNKLHKVWKLWSSNAFCEFTYTRMDFFFLIHALYIMLNSDIHICICYISKFNSFLDLNNTAAS